MAQVTGIQIAGIALIIVGSLLQNLFPEEEIMQYVSLALYIAGALTIDMSRYMFRGKIASKYGIQFGPCPDYGLVCCCPQCSLAQESKVASWGGPNPPSGGNVVGRPVGSNA